jgi:5-methylcytosine-specific restriction endonuclease McrA
MCCRAGLRGAIAQHRERDEITAKSSSPLQVPLRVPIRAVHPLAALRRMLGAVKFRRRSKPSEKSWDELKEEAGERYRVGTAEWRERQRRLTPPQSWYDWVEGKDQKRTSGRREPIPERVRNEVWRRDEGRCVDCGSRERLEFDHIIPLSRGGSSTARNLELRCESCNRNKGARI